MLNGERTSKNGTLMYLKKNELNIKLLIIKATNKSYRKSN